jgi:hypothetical protein
MMNFLSNTIGVTNSTSWQRLNRQIYITRTTENIKFDIIDKATVCRYMSKKFSAITVKYSSKRYTECPQIWLKKVDGVMPKEDPEISEYHDLVGCKSCRQHNHVEMERYRYHT